MIHYLLSAHLFPRALHPLRPFFAEVVREQQKEGVVVNHNRGCAVDQVEDQDHQDLKTAERYGSYNVINGNSLLLLRRHALLFRLILLDAEIIMTSTYTTNDLVRWRDQQSFGLLNFERLHPILIP